MNKSAPKTDTKAPEVEAKRVVPLPKTIPPSRMTVAEYERKIYRISVPDGVVLEDCLKPPFWAHTADNLRPLDQVEVHPDDGSWFATLLVRSAERMSAQVAVLSYIEFDASDDLSLAADLAVKWRGPHSKWAVIRVSDGEVLTDKFENQDIAATHMSNLQRDR